MSHISELFARTTVFEASQFTRIVFVSIHCVVDISAQSFTRLMLAAEILSS